MLSGQWQTRPQRNMPTTRQPKPMGLIRILQCSLHMGSLSLGSNKTWSGERDDLIDRYGSVRQVYLWRSNMLEDAQGDQRLDTYIY